MRLQLAFAFLSHFWTQAPSTYETIRVGQHQVLNKLPVNPGLMWDGPFGQTLRPEQRQRAGTGATTMRAEHSTTMGTITSITLESGLALLVEPMPGVSSAAISLQLPVGAARDPDHRIGESALLNEFIFRGAGGLSSREHSDALDRAGVQRSSAVGSRHLSVSATMLGPRISEALPLLASIAIDLAMEADAMEPARSLCLQELEALPDDPQHLVSLMLRERQLPPPLERHGYGRADDIAAITVDGLRDSWKQRCVPGGAMLGIAGAVDVDELRTQLDALLEGWSGQAPDITATAPAKRGVNYLQQDTSQVHLCLAYDAPAEGAADSMLERLGVNVLSGGMSGRLFTEVRERRSLCYSVGASYSAGRDHGNVTIHAGTTPERAQETLDVSVGELHRMKDGVSPEEFHRAVVGLKSRLVMQGESTGARASALVGDHFRLGRTRTLAEVADEIDRITLDELNRHLAQREFGEFSLASIGPTELTLPAVS